jgi:hypothetical protein
MLSSIFLKSLLPIRTLRSGQGAQSLLLLRYIFILYPSEVVINFLNGSPTSGPFNKIFCSYKL